MRIIGGKVRGRRLQTPPRSSAKSSASPIRPTADRAREALFNIIGSDIIDATVLDLFAGTGAIGLEALSRSAKNAVFVDNSKQAIQIIKKNIELCGFADNTQVIKQDLAKGLSSLQKQLSGQTFSIVFVDAPYRQGLSAEILKELAGSNLLEPATLIVVEEEAIQEMARKVAGMALIDHRRYGDTGFWFYRREIFSHN